MDVLNANNFLVRLVNCVLGVNNYEQASAGLSVLTCDQNIALTPYRLSACNKGRISRQRKALVDLTIARYVCN